MKRMLSAALISLAFLLSLSDWYRHPHLQELRPRSRNGLVGPDQRIDTNHFGCDNEEWKDLIMRYLPIAES